MQRYISTRPMFTNLRELQFVAQQQQQQQQAAAAAAAAASTAGAGSAEAVAAEAEAAADLAALRGLSGLYKGILGAMRDEAVVIEQVGWLGCLAGCMGLVAAASQPVRTL